MRTFVSLCAILLMLLAINGTATAQPGFVAGPFPAKMGASGGKAKDRKTLTGTTASQPAAAEGKLSMELENTTGKNVTDLHVCVTKVKQGEVWQEIETGVEIDSAETSADQASHNMPNHTTDENCVTVKSDAGDHLPDGESLDITIKIVDDQGNPIKGDEFELEAHWTKADVEVSATSTDDIGEDRPPASLTSIVPDYDPSTVESPESNDVVTCNDICLAERDGYRFQDGSIVFTSDNSSSFAIDENTEVLAFDEDGDDITDVVDRVDITNLRINDLGHFVFDIDREAGGSDPAHIVLVIRGLMVSGLDGHYAGDEIHGGVTGAGVSGRCLEDLYTLVKIVGG